MHCLCMHDGFFSSFFVLFDIAPIITLQISAFKQVFIILGSGKKLLQIFVFALDFLMSRRHNFRKSGRGDYISSKFYCLEGTE